MQDQLHAELRATLPKPLLPNSPFFTIPLYTREFAANVSRIYTRTIYFSARRRNFPLFPDTRPIDTRRDRYARRPVKMGEGEKKGGGGRKQGKINKEDESRNENRVSAVSTTVFTAFFTPPRKILNLGKRGEGRIARFPCGQIYNIVARCCFSTTSLSLIPNVSRSTYLSPVMRRKIT